MRDRWFLLLLGLSLGSFLYFSRLLVYPDLNLLYPFPGGDGYDWISNGLWWAGADVRYTVRPPLLPWVLAVLHHWGSLSFFPVLNQLLLHSAIVGLFLFLRRRHGSRVACAVATLYLVNASLLRLTLEVGADLLAVVLLMAAIMVVMAANGRPGLYPLAGLLGGMSVLAQQTALLLPFPVALIMVLRRRDHLRDVRFWLGATLFCLPPALWFLAKTMQFGSPGDVVTRHWGLLGLSFESLPFYAGSLLTWLGWPWVVAVLVGSYLWCRGPRRDEGLLMGATAALILLFFVVGYRWQSHRFLVYVVAFLGFPVAELLMRIRRPLWQGVVWGALVLGAAAPVADWPHASVIREWRGRAVDYEPALIPHLVAEDAAVVVLHRWELSAGDRYRTLYQVGNALERRVKMVPREVLPPTWWGWVTSTPLAESGPFFAERITLPADLGSAAVVRLDPPGQKEWGGDPSPLDQELKVALSRCRALDELLAYDDDFLAGVLPGSGVAPLWLQLVPFVTRTSSFYVLDAESAEHLLTTAPVEDRVSVAGLEATRVTALSRKVWVVRE